jgi:hypothetical protein
VTMLLHPAGKVNIHQPSTTRTSSRQSIRTDSTVAATCCHCSPPKAEYGTFFGCCKEGTILRRTLHDMGHPQLTTNNFTLNAFDKNYTKQQSSRAIDITFCPNINCSESWRAVSPAVVPSPTDTA